MPTTIKATLENAQQLREVIAGWPELAQTINGLRQQGMFPGLRCMSVTLEDGVALSALGPPKAQIVEGRQALSEGQS